ncbi:MAG: hypothetical protein H6R13_3456 [Proteobacteria bacterium]|nr:hypothetical protein [Pseudomonadota bacterium]
MVALGYKYIMRKTPFILLVAALLAQPAIAEIYKCRLPNGKTEISNAPCASGTTVTARPDEAVPEATRQQAERDVERMRNYVDKREAAQRAEEAAERQERASQRQAATSAPSRTYGDPAACLRDLSQQALEASQRAQLEAECRGLIRPPETIQQPVYVPIYGGPHRPHHYQPPPPKPAPQPPAPSIIMCPPNGKNCAR